MLRLNGEFLGAFDSIARTASALHAIKPLPCSLSTCTFAGRLRFDDDAPDAEQELRFGRIVGGLYDTMELLEGIDGGGCVACGGAVQRRRHGQWLEFPKQLHCSAVPSAWTLH